MNIFVSNLGFHVGSEELKDLFATYGDVASAKVITDRETQRSRGFGFIEMNDESEGSKAISELNGKVIEGREITVNVARPKKAAW